MNNYILELLQANERVIIPDFGAFMKKKDTDVIYFNEYLKFNDNLFIDFVIQKDNIEKAIAEQKVKDFVSEIKSKLAADKIYDITGLGIISADEKGRLKFDQGGKLKEEKKVELEIKDGKEEAKEQDIKNEPKKDKAKEEKDDKKIKEKDKKPSIKEEEKQETKKEKKEEKKSEEKRLTEKKEDKKSTPVPISLETIAQEKKKNQGEKVDKKTKDKKVEVKKEKAPKEKQSKKEKHPKKEKPKKEKPVKKGGDKKKSKWWLWLIIIIIVLLAALVALSLIKPDVVCKYVELPYMDCSAFVEEEVENHESEAVEDVEVHEEIVVSDTLEMIVDTLGIDSLEQTEAIEESEEEIIEEVVEEVETTEPVETVHKPSGGKVFYLVAGCFENEANANKLVNELKGQGYNAMIFGKVGRLHGVCYNYYSTRGEALKEMSKIGGSAWVLYR